MQEVKNDKKTDENQINDNQINGSDGELTEEEVAEENERKIVDNNNNRKPIYLVELFFIFPILIVADVFDIFSLTGVGAILSWAMDLITTGVVSLWLWWKGRRAEWNLIANLIEFIPVVDILPWRTVMMIILLMKDSKIGKQALGKIEKVSDKNRLKSSSSNIINMSNKEDINNKKAA